MRIKLCCLILIAVLLCVSLTGCGDTTNETTSSAIPEPAISAVSTLKEVTETPTSAATSLPAPTMTSAPADGLTDEQRNSINMLNYLAVLTQEINSSKNSRVYLENAYSSLVNNTNPQAVDSRTLSELTGILDTLESYRMIAAKRERIKYIYEQSQAQAVRSAIPNPLALISAAESTNLVSLVASVVYMAVDSYASYESAMSSADLQYLQEGWTLDDEEATALHNRRKDTFYYMTRIVDDYDLPGKLALSEEAVQNFVDWKKKSVVRKIQMLEDNQEVFKAYGGYWLALAESYYSHGDFKKCIEALDTYESLGISIYRYDREYAKVLPLAIIAAGNVYEGDTYIDAAKRYADALTRNTSNSEWALRYFAAQAYVDMYSRTNDTEYLETAYKLARGNVNYLIDAQKDLNDKYVAPVKKDGYPEGATKETKEEIDVYNKFLITKRKTELPPVYEPLFLNAELLFGLAEQLGVSEAEYQKLHDILHEDGESVFLTVSIDMMLRPANEKQAVELKEDEIKFTGDTIILPAEYVSDEYEIKAEVAIPEKGVFQFDEWNIVKVERKTEGDIKTFKATFECPALKKFDMKNGAAIAIEIQPVKGSSCQPISINYKANAREHWWIIPDSITFERG